MPILNNSDTTTKDKNQEENDAHSNIGQIEEMYRAGVHFGYSRSSRHPAMNPYLFGLRNNVEIFDLEIVEERLKIAEEFLKELGRQRKNFLLVATKPEAKDFVEKAGRELDLPYVTERWLGGTLTNFDVLKKNIKRLEDLRQRKEAGEFLEHSKKEISRLERELSRKEKRFGGLGLFNEMPSALVIIDSKEEKAAVKEAIMKNIPIVAILNSDCNPKPIDYPVPGNDTAVTSIQYLLDRLMDVYKEGLKEKPKEESTVAKGEAEKKPKEESKKKKLEKPPKVKKD